LYRCCPLTINNIDIDATLNKVKELLEKEKNVSPSLRSVIEVLVLVVTLLVNRLNLNSSNSSKPPSSDPNRKKAGKSRSGKKAGGQKGRVGVTLEKVDDPDKIEELRIDRRGLPSETYKEVGYEARQVFDIDISRVITEYRAEILADSKGNRYVASFPREVTKAVQYGTGVKAHSVYMSQYQLIPYKRIQEYFQDQLGIPVSEGSIYNFNREAFGLLESFEEKAKAKLTGSDLLHVDETGININGARHWLHCTSNGSWTHFFPHDKHEWARDTRLLLEEIRQAVNDMGGILEVGESERYRQRYRMILKEAETECSPPAETDRKGRRGRVKRTKARNLLERLRKYESDVLRFMDNKIVPFTNNLGENDIRMTKVQQKISGCFRSMEGAKTFCRIRGYLSTCRKQGVKSSEALETLFRGELPNFVSLPMKIR